MIKEFKKTAIAAIAGGSLLVSMSAQAIVVGGIDFGALGADPSNLHFETATIAQTLITGNGQSATAYGQITSVNGETNYCITSQILVVQQDLMVHRVIRLHLPRVRLTFTLQIIA